MRSSRFFELVTQSAGHHFHPEVEELLEDRLQVEPRGNGHLGTLGRQQARQVDVVIDLQRRVLEQVGKSGVGVRAGADLEHDPDVVGAQVFHVGQLRHLALADQFADPLDQRVFLDPVGNGGDHDGVGPFRMRLIGASELDRPLPRRVNLADLVRRVQDHAAGRKVGAQNVFRQPFQRQLAIIQKRDGGLANFLEVVGRNVRRHADGDPRRPVDQQVGKLGGKNLRLLIGG